jgi:hypothetical protein
MSIFLLTTRPNWIVPVFRQTDMLIEYKRFPADYIWRPFLDLSGVVYDDTAVWDAISELEATDTATLEALALIGADAATAQATADSALANAATAQTTAENAQETADEALALAGSAVGLSALPDNIYLTPENFRAIVTGFTAPTSQAGQWTHSYSDLAGSGAIGDAKVLLGAGDYEFTIGYVKAADAGNLALKIDGAGSVTAIPAMYNATTQLSQLTQGTLANGVTAGLHTIRLEVTGKAPASSGFHCRVSYVAIRRKP